MEASYNDLWQASFPVSALGRHVYTVLAWVDRFFTWQHDLARRNDPKDIAVAMRVGEELVLEAAARAPGAAGARLKEIAATLGKTTSPDAGEAARCRPRADRAHVAPRGAALRRRTTSAP